MRGCGAGRDTPRSSNWTNLSSNGEIAKTNTFGVVSVTDTDKVRLRNDNSGEGKTCRMANDQMPKTIPSFVHKTFHGFVSVSNRMRVGPIEFN